MLHATEPGSREFSTAVRGAQLRPGGAARRASAGKGNGGPAPGSTAGPAPGMIPRMSGTGIAIAAIAALLGVHLVADGRGAAAPRAVGKLGASTALVALGAARFGGGTFDRALLAGLILSWAGDALLLSARRTAFLGGLVAFLLAHLAYVVAFAGVAVPSAWVAAGVLAVTAGVLAWLWPHLGSLRGPVAAYCAVISAMLWLALGVARTEVRLGAALFYLSDLFVARDRFVRPAAANRVVGLPLYYAGQLLLALAIG